MPANTHLEANMRDEQYTELAEWAENQMALNPDSTTALRGAATAEAGRGLLDRVASPWHPAPTS